MYSESSEEYDEEVSAGGPVQYDGNYAVVILDWAMLPGKMHVTSCHSRLIFRAVTHPNTMQIQQSFSLKLLLQ